MHGANSIFRVLAIFYQWNMVVWSVLEEVAHNQSSIVDLATGHTEHVHHFHLVCMMYVRSLCGDRLTQQVEVGCVGVVQCLWSSMYLSVIKVKRILI